jgi:hypothetical protein
VTALMIVSQLCEEKARVLFRRCSFNFKGKSCLSYLSRYLSLLSVAHSAPPQPAAADCYVFWLGSVYIFLFKEENKKNPTVRLAFFVCVWVVDPPS